MPATIQAPPTLQLSERFTEPDHGQRCQQIVHSTTGERPIWVTYDTATTQAIAHLRSPTNSARYMLGAAGYRHDQTLQTGELWILRATPSTAHQQRPKNPETTRNQ